MLVLLLLYLASHSWAKDVPHDTNYKFTNVSSCPETGYFFKTVPTPNTIEGNCYLCFCQDDSTAICWQRENRKCDTQHYKHNTTVARKETRVKRSPLGLGDIFFKDAAREVFNRKEEEVCKPYESSFSEGCPPADWCLGCTVCDCDANGHWDCHILSFCDDDKKGKDHRKGSKKMAVSYAKPRKSTTAKIAKTTKKTPVRSVKTAQRDTTTKPKPVGKLRRSQAKPKNVKTAKPRPPSKPSKSNVQHTNNNKNRPTNKKPTKHRSVIQKGKPVKPLIIKKNDKNRKVVKYSPSKRVMNGSEAQMSEALMNTMRKMVQQMWNRQVTDAIPSIVQMIQKRSFPGKFNQSTTKSNKGKKITPKPKLPKMNKGKPHIFNKSLFIRKAVMEERKKEKIRKRELEEKAKARKFNKGKKVTKRSKRDLYLNSDSDLVAAMAIPEQFMTVEPPVYYSNESDNLFTETATSPYIQMDFVTLTDAINSSLNMQSINDEVKATEPSVQNLTNSYIDDNTTTEKMSSPHMELDYTSFADTTNSSISMQPVNEVTAPLVQNKTNSFIDDITTDNAGIDVFSFPRIELDKAENATYMQFISNYEITESPSYNGSFSGDLTITTANITNEFPSFAITSDIAENSTYTPYMTNNSNETFIIVPSDYNSSVDVIVPIIVVDTSSSAQDNSDAVKNITMTTSDIQPAQATAQPSLYNSSSANTFISTETFSLSYIPSDAVNNTTNIPPSTPKVIGEPNETLDYSVLSVDYKFNVVPETTPSPMDSAFQSKASTSKQFSKTVSRGGMYVDNLVATTPMPITNTDTDIKVTSTSTQPPIETITNIITSSYISPDFVANLTNLSFTSENVYTPSSTNNISANHDHVTVTENVLSSNNYYEYTVNLTSDKPESEIEKNYNTTETNIITVLKNGNHFDHKTEELKHNFAGEMPDEAENEIKSSKWSEEKPFKDIKKLTADPKINKTDMFDKFKDKLNQTKWRASKKDKRRKVHRKDIERKIDKTTKKYSLTRVINSNLYKAKRGGGIKDPDMSRVSLSNKIENLRNVLKRLLSEFHKNNTLPNENKKKSANAIKYLKRFFNKLFYNKNSNKTIISQRLRNNNHTIKMLCESFGPCVINKKNKLVLTKKIKELNNETIQILKSLRIIKGLLRLVDIPRNFAKIPLNETSNFKNDIHKLNLILKLKDGDNDGMKKLTETQRTQIEYIKSNTKAFKQSVARFTKVLNQIIDMISIKGNKENQRRWYSEAKIKQARRNATKQDTIKKFKTLLHNYNLIHNVFINKIIQIFSSLQGHTDIKKINTTSDFINTEYNSEKIANNLNKLKNLASALNQGRRQKRHAVRQENAMEYLLMLMEYMLHQNTRPNAAPVNDGIDLLIEAIKNAPDIKTVQNKAVNYNQSYTATLQKDQTSIPVTTDNVLDTYIISDDRISNKIDNSSSIDQDTQEEAEHDTILQLQKTIPDKIEDDQSEKNLRTASEIIPVDFDNNEQMGNDSPDTEKKFRAVNEALYKETTEKLSEIDKNNDIEYTSVNPKAVYMAKYNTPVEFDSRLQKTSGEYKNNKLFATESDDDNLIEETTSVPTSTQNNEEDFTENPMNTRTPYSVKEDTTEITIPKTKVYDSNETSLEWHDEKDYYDNNGIKNTIDGTEMTRKPNIQQKHNLETGNKFEDDLSDASENSEKAKAKVKKTEDVLKRKEEDLLNSLDYGGTDATMMEDTKDDNDEKFTTDYFAD